MPEALATAVEYALALDPAERYASADDMRKALKDGARGISPPGGESTAATSMLSSREPTAATRAVPGSRRLEPQAPRHPPPAQPAYDPESGSPSSARSRGEAPRRSNARRWVGSFVVAAIAAAAIAYAVGTTSGGGNVKLSPVDGNTTGEVVDQMERLIDDNTR